MYCTTPIVKEGTDPCFDGRNHLYFSDGDQWIPLANCLPSSKPSSGGGDCCGESFEISGDNEPYLVKKEDSGKTGFFVDAHPNNVAVLPEISETDPDSDGLCYKFVTGTTFTGGGWSILSEFPPPPPPSNKFAGQINWISGGGSVPNNTDNLISSLQATSTAGDWVEVYSFKGKWYVTGESWENEGIEFSTP